LSSSDVESVSPGGVFVVGRVVSEAAVEDADEAVREGSQGPVVGVAGGASLVVERPSTGAGRQGGERPEVAGVSEAAVAGVAGEHDAVFA
jgi:hypothetical protein